MDNNKAISEDSKLSQNWKTPNEIIKLQRLKQKRKALQARLIGIAPQENTSKSTYEQIYSNKRKNPFSKSISEPSKRQKNEPESPIDTEDTIFKLINQTEKPQKPPIPNFAQFIQPEADDTEITEEPKYIPHLPIDWSLKSRIRILCKNPLPGTNLKTSQEASGLTSFVRCIDPQNSSTGLDISPSARFYQTTLYWQHPHLPWLTLFPRNSKANIGLQVGEVERVSLIKDWAESFRGLFQLIRARQCPYFYVCANTFTVLFRAAGIGGRVETHALLSPTTRGMRSALKQEDIEFTQPFKDSGLNRSNEGNSSLTEDSTQELNTNLTDNNVEEDDDDLCEEEWLQSLGVDSSEIKKINSLHARKVVKSEMNDDFSDSSLVLIEGVECQAFFNFLLNSKSTVANVGRLAGIPPTLLAPVAFTGATMRSLQTRSSKVRLDATDYFSIELKGVILPHVLPYQCSLLLESQDSFSATLTSNLNTLAFSKASKKLLEDAEKQCETSDQVFGKENLSDCGLQPDITDAMCRVGKDAVNIMDRMCYSKELGGYTWS